MSFISCDDFALDEYKPSDLLDLFKYRSNTRINRFYSIVPKNKEELDSYLKKHIIKFGTDPGYSLFIIRKCGNIIGDISINCWGYQSKICGIGYAISPENQRKGHAYNSLRIFINELFRKYEKKRIQATLDPDNIPSIKLLEKLKFKKEGYLREVEYDNGIWKDEAIYALINEEWNENSVSKFST
jgi:ribosomal-protein-alanine N-acetyltransferase